MTIAQLLQLTVDRQASDLHLVVGFVPRLRINGELDEIPGEVASTEADLTEAINFTTNEIQRQLLAKKLDLDLGFTYQQKARFRINFYKQSGTWAASFRYIPGTIRAITETGLPQSAQKLTELRQGLILMTGPTGQGKSTTLASFIQHINELSNRHIITIEDPIEFTYPKGKSLISQRELNQDTLTWAEAIRDSLRQDPDVILIGEIRDLETISATMTLAETGHLVFATIHTNSAAQSVDRIIDVFPEHQQAQIRTQLASVIEAIISLRLVPTVKPGRVLAAEIAYGNPALRSLIREGKSHLIDNLIQTSGEFGMRLLETSLAELVKNGTITQETALKHAIRPGLLMRLDKLNT